MLRRSCRDHILRLLFHMCRNDVDGLCGSDPPFMHAANEVSGDNLALLLACIQKDVVLVMLSTRPLSQPTRDPVQTLNFPLTNQAQGSLKADLLELAP